MARVKKHKPYHSKDGGVNTSKLDAARAKLRKAAHNHNHANYSRYEYGLDDFCNKITSIADAVEMLDPPDIAVGAAALTALDEEIGILEAIGFEGG